MKTKENPNSTEPQHRAPRWLRSLATFALLATLALSAANAAPGLASPGGKRGLDTFTANLYVGTGIERIIALDPADYPTELVPTVTGV